MEKSSKETGILRTLRCLTTNKRNYSYVYDIGSCSVCGSDVVSTVRVNVHKRNAIEIDSVSCQFFCNGCLEVDR